eukprot:scpid80146/ scgid16052/ 
MASQATSHSMPPVGLGSSRHPCIGTVESDGTPSNSGNESDGRQPQGSSGRWRVREGGGRRTPTHSGLLKRRVPQHGERQMRKKSDVTTMKECIKSMEKFLKPTEASKLPAGRSSFFFICLVLLLCVLAALSPRILPRIISFVTSRLVFEHVPGAHPVT